MAEERITTVETGDAPPTTRHTTVVQDGESRSSGAGWMIAIVLLIAVVAGIYFLSQTMGSQTNKDNAIAEAAGDVGAAASQVGDAATDAVDNIQP